MADEDIFMDYGNENDSNCNIHQSIPKLPISLPEISAEKMKIFANLKNFKPTELQENRLKVLELRRFNRHVANVIAEHRRKMNDLKGLVDNLNSKLVCQKFEKQHLLDEIKSCLSSKNIFENIELEPVTGENDASEHEIMIQRLQRELHQRQELQSKLTSILQRKQQTEVELDKKKRKMEELRGNLQNLLKNSKPLIEACGYDVEAFHKKKMAIDEVVAVKESQNNFESNENDRDNEENILALIYEKLVTFVADKPEFKLRYFNPIPVASDKYEEDEAETFEFEEDGRNSSIKSDYIQIKMEIEAESVEPVDIFLKLQNNQLFLTFQHELIPANGVATWLKSLGTIEFLESNESWLPPTKLQPDTLNYLTQDSEDFNQIFSAIRDALQLRNQLQLLVQNHYELLEFDKNNVSELVLLPDSKLKAQISMNTITWYANSEGFEDFIGELNAVGAKYRSVLDCLQAQLELILSNK